MHDELCVRDKCSIGLQFVTLLVDFRHGAMNLDRQDWSDTIEERLGWAPEIRQRANRILIDLSDPVAELQLLVCRIHHHYKVKHNDTASSASLSAMLRLVAFLPSPVPSDVDGFNLE